MRRLTPRKSTGGTREQGPGSVAVPGPSGSEPRQADNTVPAASMFGLSSVLIAITVVELPYAHPGWVSALCGVIALLFGILPIICGVLAGGSNSASGRMRLPRLSPRLARPGAFVAYLLVSAIALLVLEITGVSR